MAPRSSAGFAGAPVETFYRRVIPVGGHRGERRRSPRFTSVRRGGLEASDKLARVAGEVGPSGGRGRLAGGELLAERGHVGAGVDDAGGEVGAGRQPGGAGGAGDLALGGARGGT